ncbi:MAG: cupin domain-containing protein, partial [Actinomycetota bacterium]|nr:cupin domain-containing protein [Actinomycetota bacterium]
MAIVDEVTDHSYRTHPRIFTLPESADHDLRSVATEVWSDLARVGPLWSTVRIVHNGDDLHPSRFMQGHLSDGLVVHSTINSRAVADYLDQGATLIYNHLHETSRAVQRIQEILEYRLNAKMWIQAYVTKAGETAFGSHRDDHNFVVLQLHGAKLWETEAEGGGLTRSRLRAGDGLFVRSGTEHAVSGVGELSLHLTIAFDWLTSASAQPGSTVSEVNIQSRPMAWMITGGPGVGFGGGERGARVRWVRASWASMVVR